MSIIIIAAVAANGVIGANNSIPWHIPEDFKHFKETTKDAAVVMGRNTWESLPKKPLPGRINIVVCNIDKGPPTLGFKHLSRTLENACSFAQFLKVDSTYDAYVIGGSAIYAGAMRLADQLIITHLTDEYEGDTYFPPIANDDWVVTHEKPLTDKAVVKYYSRRHD